MVRAVFDWKSATSGWLIGGLIVPLVLGGCAKRPDPPPATPPGFSIASVSLPEHARGQSAASRVVELRIDLSPANGQDTSVRYRIIDANSAPVGSNVYEYATAGSDFDVGAMSGTLSFPAGTTSTTVSFTLHDDALYELNERVVVQIEGAVGADIVNGEAVVTIENDDARPTASIAFDAARTSNVQACNDGANCIYEGYGARAPFNITLSAPSGLPATIPLVPDGAALHRGDYVVLDASDAVYDISVTPVTIAPGETSAAFNVEIIDDGDDEVDEAISIRFSNSLTYVMPANGATALALRIPASDPMVYALDAMRKLNDTGIAKWANLNTNMATSEPVDAPNDYVRQDASAPQGALSFTKLDANGNADAALTQWNCVKDNTTGLIWEAKVASNGELRSQSSTYTWYNNDTLVNGGDAGSQGSACTAGVCNTAQYVAEINRQALCGMTGWRLPTIEELRGIADYGWDYTRKDAYKASTQQDAIYAVDLAYFSDTYVGGYWSSTPSAASAGRNEVWIMNYYLSPQESVVEKSVRQYVRVVNDGR